MPEDKPQPNEVPKIEEEVKDTLKGVLGWVQKQKVRAADPTQKVSTAKPWGWVVGLVVAVLVFGALAFLAWKAWSKGREIAKLKHELDVNKEEARQKVVNAAIARDKERREKLESEARELEIKAVRLKGEIAAAETERVNTHKAIEAVTTWEDVDKIFDSRS